MFFNKLQSEVCLQIKHAYSQWPHYSMRKLLMMLCWTFKHSRNAAGKISAKTAMCPTSCVTFVPLTSVPQWLTGIFHTTFRKKQTFPKAYQIQCIINDWASLQDKKQKALSSKPIKGQTVTFSSSFHSWDINYTLSYVPHHRGTHPRRGKVACPSPRIND